MKSRNLGNFRTLLSTLMLVVLLLQTGFVSAASSNNDYLHAGGNKLYDASQSEVRLTGIAWFGFETELQVYHGLWSVKMENVLDTVANRGFNLLRIPLSVQLVNQWRNGNGGSPGSVNYSANPDLQGMTSLQILDASVAYAKRVGLKVMLDMHRVINTQQKEGWYTTGYPPEDFEACWKWLAEHYKDDDTVIAADLFNEPHGAPGNTDMIKWDSSSDKNNWNHEAAKIANQILDINPNLLVVVQGVEATPKDGYTYAETNGANYNSTWWGGNLRGVKDAPVDLGSRQNQLVYSPHDYGPSVYAQPWFHSGFTEASVTADCWDPNWLYIAKQNIAPILVGEWGGRLDGGDNQKWMEYLAHTITSNKLSHTFWTVNPNSGDTGGILLDDWTSVDTAKYDLVKPTLWQDSNGKFIGLDHEVNLGANGTHVGGGTSSSTNNAGGVPVTEVTPSPTQPAVTGNAPAGCNAPVSSTLPLVLNGVGDLCRVTSGSIGNINSWNTQLVEINGVAYTNTYLDKMPARIDGNYYIHYVGKYAWSHLEVNGSGGSTSGNSTISPATASFDKNTAKQANVAVSMTQNGNTLNAIRNGSATLVAGTDYTVSGNAITILKRYLAKQTAGTVALTFDFSAGTDPVLTVTVSDTSGGAVNYTLTVAVSGNGSTSLTTGAHTYASGTSVSVTATPASGATFTGWGGAATGTTNPVKVTMNGNKTLTANFSGGSSGLPGKCPGTCNSATPTPPTPQSDGGLGNVTMYSTGPSAGGACNYGSTKVMYYAAMSVNVAPGDGKGQWQGGHICGQCAEVTALTSQGPKTVVVRIMDKCPDGNCGIDLGGSAPGAVMLDGAGRYDGKWRFVSCDAHPEVSDGTPTLDVVTGSNSWWSRVRVRNPATGVASIEWQDTSGSTHGTLPFATDPENAYEVPVNEVLQSHTASFLITVHYVDGRTATARLTPAQLGASGGTYPIN